MSAPISVPASQPVPEGCPPPLQWQEVCRAVEEEARSRVIEFEGGAPNAVEFGSGRPLVVLPGTLAGPRLFFLIAWLLKEEFRCILLGHPEWPRVPAAGDLLDKTAAIHAAAIGYLARDGADLYASSWGGQVALRILSRDPQRVTRAILQGTWAHRRYTRTEQGLLIAGRLWGGPLHRVPGWQGVQQVNHKRWFPPFDETRFGFLLAETGRVSSRQAAQRMQAAAATDLSAELQTIGRPVLLLRCEGEGEAVARSMQELEQKIPGAVSDVLSMTGQYPYLTHPHRLAKILRTFLQTSFTVDSHS